MLKHSSVRLRVIAGCVIFTSASVAFAQSVIGVISQRKARPAEEIASDIDLQSGHVGRIAALAFSPVGNVLASAGDKTVQLWDVAQGLQLFCLRGHSGLVRSLAFSADGRHLASGSNDHTVRIWAVGTGESVATLKMQAESIVQLAFSPDGSVLVAAGGAAQGDGEGPVILWDVATGQEIRTLEAKAAGVTHVFFSADGARVSVADRHGDMEDRGSIRTYDRATGQLVGTRAAVVKAATDDGSWIALGQGGGERAEVVIINSQDNGPGANVGEKVGPVVFGPGGGWLAYSPYPYGTATVKRSSGGDAHSLNGEAGAPWHFDTLAVSAEGRWLASADNGPNVEIWDVPAGRLIHTLSGQFGVNALAFDAAGKRLAVGSGGGGEGALRFWDLRTQAAMPTPRFDRGLVGAAFSPDGKSVAVASRSLELFAVGSDVPVREFRCASDVVISPVFSPDGKLIAGNCRGVVTVWSVETGAEVLHFGEPNILNATSVAFSPNGRLLATGGLQDLRVYDLAARRVAVTWPTTAPVSAIAFSGDGRLIAAGTRVQLRGQLTDGSMVLAPVPGQSAAVAVWDLASGQRVWWAPAGQWVSAVAFSPDGRFTLASSGEEWESTGSVRMFNAANGLLVGTPLAKVDSHSAAAFSPDGEWFAAAPQQGGIGARLWKIR